MSQLLYLIRHGYSLHNELFKKMGVQAFRIPEVIDSPLIEEGKQQAEELSKVIHEKEIDLVLVSPLVRTLETANIIFKDINIPIKCMEMIREYPMGEDTCNQRKDKNELVKLYPHIDFSEIKEDKDIYWKPERESIENLEKRIDLVKKYIKQLDYKKIAIVSHNSFMGQFKDKYISYTENGDEELKHCYPYLLTL